MQLPKDWREFIELLNSNEVDFLIVGGVAVAWHGHPRFTSDIDILVRPTSANAECVIQALRQFGFPQLGLTPADMNQPDQIIQLGYPPNRIDLLTSISGVDFDDAWAARVEGEIDGVRAKFIGFDDLIRNKESTVEGAIQVVDSTTPVARAFVRFGGPQAHGHSLTVAAR